MANAPGESGRSARKTRPEGPGRRIRRAGISLAAALAVVLLSFPGWANEYKRGYRSCDFIYAEKEYRKDSERLINQVLYGKCLVIKGEDARGLVLLYQLEDRDVTASYFIAEYLMTDGQFGSSTTKDKIEEAIGYYLRTLALIALIPDYPEPDYLIRESYEQMELFSLYNIVSLYLKKYDLGIVGDYRKHLLQSPGYQGDRELSTYGAVEKVLIL